MKKLLISILTLGLLSCEKELQKVALVYDNDFESMELDRITGGLIHTFNGEQMLGNYNNDGFVLTLNNMGDHRSILVTFDLYIHDAWDGNAESPNGPDLWIMEIDAPQKAETNPNYFRTSFSNSNCLLCDYQSFPGVYPFSKSPKSGSTNEPIPGLCHYATLDYGTTLYSIEKTFQHSGNALVIQFYDELIQLNTENPNCDESWSLDNLKVWVLKYD